MGNATATATKPKEDSEKKVETTPAQQTKPDNVVAIVTKQVAGYLTRGSLFLPGDYSPENALKSAWLTLQTVENRDGGLALNTCTQASIANALLDMVVQGLNPSKKQCYFIAYGKQLSCQRSYFGDQALAVRAKPGIEIYSGVVFKGDAFEYSMLRGRKIITKHEQKLGNVDTSNIVAAYCGSTDASGQDLGCEIMTIDQIKKSWAKSKTYSPNKAGTPHNDQPDQMALRTVIRRYCKPIINAANDSLLLESVRRQEIQNTEDAIDTEATDLGNGEEIPMTAPPLRVEESTSQEPAAASEMTDAQLQDLAKARGDMTYKDNAGQTRVTATGAITDEPQPSLEAGY